MTDLPADLLEHRGPDSRDAPSLNWGIIGPGWIAERFIASLQQFTTQNVTAFGSGNRARYEEATSGHEGGLHFEAAAVARSSDAAEIENAHRPLADAIGTLAVMDAIRAQIGVVFPGEETET